MARHHVRSHFSSDIATASAGTYSLNKTSSLSRIVFLHSVVDSKLASEYHRKGLKSHFVFSVVRQLILKNHAMILSSSCRVYRFSVKHPMFSVSDMAFLRSYIGYNIRSSK